MRTKLYASVGLLAIVALCVVVGSNFSIMSDSSQSAAENTIAAAAYNRTPTGSTRVSARKGAPVKRTAPPDSISTKKPVPVVSTSSAVRLAKDLYVIPKISSPHKEIMPTKTVQSTSAKFDLSSFTKISPRLNRLKLKNPLPLGPVPKAPVQPKKTSAASFGSQFVAAAVGVGTPPSELTSTQYGATLYGFFTNYDPSIVSFEAFRSPNGTTNFTSVYVHNNTANLQEQVGYTLFFSDSGPLTVGSTYYYKVVITTATQTYTTNVTPIQFVQSYTLQATANPTAGGTVTGPSTVARGGSDAIAAYATPGYILNNWTDNGVTVASSTSIIYIFNNVTANHTLVANFVTSSHNYPPSPLSAGIADNGQVLLQVTNYDPAITSLEFFVSTASQSTGFTSIGKDTNMENLRSNTTMSYAYFDTNPPAAGTTYYYKAVITTTVRTYTTNVFTLAPGYSIQVSANPSTRGTVQPASTLISSGGQVIIYAYANSGSILNTWTDNGTTISSSSIVQYALNNVSANHVITANFVAGSDNYPPSPLFMSQSGPTDPVVVFTNYDPTATHFEIFRSSVSSTSGFTKIYNSATNGVDIRSQVGSPLLYWDTPPGSGTYYYYVIIYTPTRSYTTNTDSFIIESIPTAPVLLTPYAYSDAVKLSWTYTSPIIGVYTTVHIYKSTSGGPFAEVLSTSGNPFNGSILSPTWEVKNLQPNTSYSFKISAENSLGTSPMSNTVSITTKPAQPAIADRNASIALLILYKTLPAPVSTFDWVCNTTNAGMMWTSDFFGNQAHKYGVARPFSSFQCLPQAQIPSAYLTGNLMDPINKTLLASNLATDPAIPQATRTALSQASYVQIVYYAQADSSGLPAVSDCCETGYRKYGFAYIAPYPFGTLPTASITDDDVWGNPYPVGSLISYFALASLGVPDELGDGANNQCAIDPFTGQPFTNQDIMCGMVTYEDDMIISSSTAAYLHWFGPFHPGDTNKDWDITAAEVASILYCYRNNNCGGSVVQANSVSTAASLYRNGSSYHYDSTISIAPAWWVKGTTYP